MNTKLIVALVLIGVLTLTVIGLASAQTAAPGKAAPNGTPNSGFFGWIGRCFGFDNSQYYGSQAPAYQSPLPANITVTDPNTGQITTYQGYNGFGRGGCMRGFFP